MNDLRQEYEHRLNQSLKPLAQRLEAYLCDCMADVPRIDKVAARAKSLESFLVKAASRVDEEPKYTDPLNQIQDQLGARIVTFYLDDIDIVAERVEELFRPIEARTVVPDSDSEFAYFGRHYMLLLPREVLASTDAESLPFFELQLKTLYQHAWSQANHDLGYKPDSELTSDFRRRIAFTSAQSWGADRIFNELYREANSASE